MGARYRRAPAQLLLFPADGLNPNGTLCRKEFIHLSCVRLIIGVCAVTVWTVQASSQCGAGGWLPSRATNVGKNRACGVVVTFVGDSLVGGRVQHAMQCSRRGKRHPWPLWLKDRCNSLLPLSSPTRPLLAPLGHDESASMHGMRPVLAEPTGAITCRRQVGCSL